MGEIKIPPEYFFDFLRGVFDGDGCFYSYWDPRWKSSHMFYLEFASGSSKHISLIQEESINMAGVVGRISERKSKTFFQLKYAKKEALVIIKKMYYNPNVVCLSRKKFKIQKALRIEEKQQDNYK